MTAVEFERVFEGVEALACGFVAAVGYPAIGLQEDCRAEETVAVPPI